MKGTKKSAKSTKTKTARSSAARKHKTAVWDRPPLMHTFLLEHCGDGTALLGAYESRPAAEGMLRELPQDERYTVTEVPLNRRPGAGLADNMGSMNHWHYRGCVEDKGDVDECAEDKGNAETGKPRLGDCYRDGVAYCLAYDANGRVELDGKTFTALDMGIDGGAAKALHRHMNPLPPGDLPHFVVALRLERVALRPEQVAGGTRLTPWEEMRPVPRAELPKPTTCPKCGVDGSGRFCTECGARMTE